LVIGCAAPPALRTASPASPETPAPAPDRSEPESRVLPAGIFFRSHTYRPCAHVDESEQEASGLCTEPTAAVVTGVFADPRDAERALATARVPKLSPGYPFAAHSDELGLADPGREGVAVILGLFETSSAADRWLAEHPVAGAERVRLLDADAAFARYDQGAQRHAVVIDADAPVPAYAARHFEWREDREPERVVVGKTAPLCHVEPGAVFVAHGEQMQSSWYDFAPVRCGGEVALVEWIHTRLTATVWRRSNGTAELLQIVEVSCDRPTFEAWSLDLHGARKAKRDVKVALGPC
jgi:hypothetical protein